MGWDLLFNFIRLNRSFLGLSILRGGPILYAPDATSSDPRASQRHFFRFCGPGSDPRGTHPVREPPVPIRVLPI